MEPAQLALVLFFIIMLLLISVAAACRVQEEIGDSVTCPACKGVSLEAISTSSREFGEWAWDYIDHNDYTLRDVTETVHYQCFLCGHTEEAVKDIGVQSKDYKGEAKWFSEDHPPSPVNSPAHLEWHNRFLPSNWQEEKASADFRKVLRTWTSTTGTTVVARIISISSDEVKLARADGVVIDVPKSKLSKEDNEFLESVQ